MNCATHSNAEAVAYCRTCGKALCANCSRDVRGVIYCENCLAARLEGTQPPASGFVSSTTTSMGTGTASSGPNAALAGILSIFPGVGAVYNGQYTKGLAYMGIFVLLIVATAKIDGLIFGLALGFFCVYQMIDAVRSARAIQMGQPAPDPLGVGQAFSPGERIDVAKIPTGAVVLIVLGVLFLLNTTLDLHLHAFWPLFLIALGVWLGAVRLGVVGHTCTPGSCNPRTLMGPAVLVTLGILFLVESLGGPGFGRTWPVLLLVIGAIKLLSGNVFGTSSQPPAPPSGPGTVQGEVPPPSGEVKNV